MDRRVAGNRGGWKVSQALYAVLYIIIKPLSSQTAHGDEAPDVNHERSTRLTRGRVGPHSMSMSTVLRC